MKIMHVVKSGILLFLVIILFSCSKDEVITPKHESSYKDVPDLIASRQDYALLDEAPSFPGGDSLFMQYLKENIKYPKDALDNQISGRVFISFIVENDGSLSGLEILKGLGYGCDEEVRSAFSNMPPWSSGKIRGNAVRVKLIIPVEFKRV